MLYNAAGQMTQERFGTTTQLYHSMTYNKRFQMYDNRLGTSVLGWNRGLLLTYYSVAARQIGWPGYETSGNNGNVWAMSDGQRIRRIFTQGGAWT